MVLQTWDPLRDLLSLQERMNRLFEESLARTQGVPPASSAGLQPPADVFETEHGFVVEIDLPGCAPEQIAVDVTPQELVVRGTRPAWTSPRPERFHRMERAHGPVARSFRFGQPIVPEGVSCRFENGWLRVEVPKAAARSRRIPVEERS